MGFSGRCDTISERFVTMFYTTEDTMFSLICICMCCITCVMTYRFKMAQSCVVNNLTMYSCDIF